MSSPRESRVIRPGCASVRPLLSLAVGGDATAEEAEQVRRHTAECPHCAAEQAELHWARRALRRGVPADRMPAGVGQGQPPVDEQFFSDLQGRVLDRVGRGSAGPVRRRNLRPWALPLSLAAAALWMMTLERPQPEDPMARATGAEAPAAVSTWPLQDSGTNTASWHAPRVGEQVWGRSGALQGLQGIDRLEGLLAVPPLEALEPVAPREAIGAFPPAMRQDQPLDPAEQAWLESLPWLEAGPDGWVLRPGKRR